jgi:hypothetical protein
MAAMTSRENQEYQEIGTIKLATKKTETLLVATANAQENSKLEFENGLSRLLFVRNKSFYNKSITFDSKAVMLKLEARARIVIRSCASARGVHTNRLFVFE